jgi:hypothetical protein
MPSDLTLEQQIECIRFHFQQLDEAMIQYHQETQLAQSSNNKRLITLESKVAFLETMQSIERVVTPLSVESQPQPKHDNCHCVIL